MKNKIFKQEEEPEFVAEDEVDVSDLSDIEVWFFFSLLIVSFLSICLSHVMVINMQLSLNMKTLSST